MRTAIRDSKKTGEKMVYPSVLDYPSAKWAEAAGVDVCVVGDSLAMTCHGHPNTIPATMDMMVLHSQAVRRGARQCDALHAGGGMRRGEAARRKIAGAHPESAGRCGDSHRLAHRAHAAHGS